MSYLNWPVLQFQRKSTYMPIKKVEHMFVGTNLKVVGFVDDSRNVELKMIKELAS